MGVDLVETNEGLKVIEINVGAEFHGLMETTDIDIAGEILDYVVQKAGATAGTRSGIVSGGAV
jgi:[lysine-biosynthesis-protein LysW]--L-2-aminoadipate ligase